LAGFVVPVYLLDSDLPENSEWDRKLTHYLYGGDSWYRLCQETVLGIGGVRMLRALGHNNLTRFHMNEGHASLLTIELLYEQARKANRKTIVAEDLEAVRQQCIFTTHTPVPAGHDQFTLDMVQRLMGQPTSASTSPMPWSPASPTISCDGAMGTPSAPTRLAARTCST